MGKNFYRLPNADELAKKRAEFIKEITEMDDADFCFGFSKLPEKLHTDFGVHWNDEEGNDFMVHLGKYSVGWKFIWNFHRNRFYSTKDELLAFIRSGRVFDEDGNELDPEKFIQDALGPWSKGITAADYVKDHPEAYLYHHMPVQINDLEVDFPSQSSTYFS